MNTSKPITVAPAGTSALEKKLSVLSSRVMALEARIDELEASKPAGRSPIDPRTLVELVDQRLKEALEGRFRAILGHLENDVIPRAVKKHASES
jgi:hypothetical protein